MSVIDVIV